MKAAAWIKDALTRPLGGFCIPLIVVMFLAASQVAETDQFKTKLVAASIDNHLDAREHQRGIPKALLVFEMLVEGDITRFLTVYDSNTLPTTIGPIRSVRRHFIEILEPLRPLLLHAGFNADGEEALTSLELSSHDGIRYDGETYERFEDSPAPHNLFIRGETAQDVIKRAMGVQTQKLPLYTLGFASSAFGRPATEVKVDLGSEDHNITFAYSKKRKRYTRSVKGAEEQAKPANIIILESQITGLGEEGYSPWTDTTGHGNMLFFSNGTAQSGNWERNKGEMFHFFSSTGPEILLAPGQTWILLLPSLEAVEWE